MIMVYGSAQLADPTYPPSLLLIEGGQKCEFPPQWLVQAKAILCARFKDRLRLDELAEEVAVHPAHLAKSFRRYFGCTVFEFLHSLRLKEALRLVCAEQTTVGHAALEAGFCDHAHLTRLCRRELGASPIELKKRFLEAH